MAIKDIIVPDVGGATGVEVIEILVKPGDTVSVDDGLLTLESDKASMDVPSPLAGTIKEVKVKLGDKIDEGSLIFTIETEADKATSSAEPAKLSAQEVIETGADKAISAAQPAKLSVQEVKVPDTGGATGVEVIEINVKPGDVVAIDDGLITLESDKASMDVPSPYAGTVKDVKVTIGDKVSEGSIILTMETMGIASKPTHTESSSPQAPVAIPSQTQTSARDQEILHSNNTATVYAGPSVRRIAQEFGVKLTLIKGSGRKGRIVKEDVQAYVKRGLEQFEKGSGGAGLDLLPWPKVDFKKFGEVEVKELNKIKRATARNLHRNWVMIPHITQFDDADITDMEAFRQAHKKSAADQGYKLTPIVFIIKAVVAALKQFPVFNSSLDDSGDNLILKKYYNIGIAVDTPNGLVVPVIKNADIKSLSELARELGEISIKAREGQLKLNDMQGGNFAISSLGGIGGTAFTPIVNAPDVAILGVSKSSIKPVFVDGAFVPRLMLPLSLSYDHRVIDGADGARFISFLSQRLSDVGELVL